MPKKSAEAARPWAKFWWKNWLADLELRSCSIASRGLWMDMLCVASSGEPYGHLTIAGKPVSVERLAQIAGITPKVCRSLLAELRDAGVFSETDEGIIYSRRMVRDKAASDLGRSHGITGGNPDLMQADNRKGKEGGITPPDKLEDRGQKKERYSDLRSASGDAGGTDARSALWQESVPILRDLTGKSDPQVRRMLGQWLRDLSDDCTKLRFIIAQCADARPAEPVSWITAAVANQGGTRSRQPSKLGWIAQDLGLTGTSS